MTVREYVTAACRDALQALGHDRTRVFPDIAPEPDADEGNIRGPSVVLSVFPGDEEHFNTGPWELSQRWQIDCRAGQAIVAEVLDREIVNRLRQGGRLRSAGGPSSFPEQGLRVFRRIRLVEVTGGD